jgi:hypothetical protein
LFQGEITLPICLSLFLNDIEIQLQENMDAWINIDQTALFAHIR